MACTVKDYRVIAKTLGEELGTARHAGRDEQPVNMITNRLVNYFKSTNPRFNEGTFFGAVNDAVEETTKGLVGVSKEAMYP